MKKNEARGEQTVDNCEHVCNLCAKCSQFNLTMLHTHTRRVTLGQLSGRYTDTFTDTDTYIYIHINTDADTYYKDGAGD